jgi:hypothetical protein
MTSTDTAVPTLFRPAFFDGQRLLADDLAAINTFHRELRWLHSRSLHSWGIALGLAVHGSRGEREVTVEPGYALDCLGRDLLLAQPVTRSVPPLAGDATGPATLYLTASYLDDADLAPSESRSGVCEGNGATRRPETLQLRWQDPTDEADETRLRAGHDVILARASIQSCKLAEAVSLEGRREARPSDQPYLGSGQTPEGGTIWSRSTANAVVLVSTFVDTSSGRFSSTPAYQATVVGERVVKAASGNQGGQFIEGFVEILEPSRIGFKLQMTMPVDIASGTWTMNPSAELTAAKVLTNLKKWYVAWFGIEG